MRSYRDLLIADRVTQAFSFGEPGGLAIGVNPMWGTLTHNSSPTRDVEGIQTGEPEAAVTYVSASSQYSSGNVQLTQCDPTVPPWSFELWVKTTESTGFQTIGCLRNTFNDNSGNCIIFGTFLTNAGDLNMTYTTGGDTNTHLTSLVHTYNDGNWHHMVGTVTAGKVAAFYVDGVLQVTGGTLQSASTSGGALMNVAANVTGSGPIQFFDGTVAWPAAYSYALTPSQVTAHYLAGIRGIFRNNERGSRRRRG